MIITADAFSGKNARFRKVSDVNTLKRRYCRPLPILDRKSQFIHNMKESATYPLSAYSQKAEKITLGVVQIAGTCLRPVSVYAIVAPKNTNKQIIDFQGKTRKSLAQQLMKTAPKIMQRNWQTDAL
jgi:hypothetical protein